MDRRTFVISSVTAAAGVGALGLGRWIYSGQPYKLAIAYGDWVDTDVELVDPPKPSYLALLDPSTLEAQLFPVPFRVHNSIQNPSRPEEVILIPKWGTSLAIFNQKEGRVTKVQEGPADHRYFGHGVWDAHAGGLWISQQNDRTTTGKLTLVNGDLQPLRDIPAGGLFPHEVQMAAPGVLLVATSGDFDNKHGNLAPQQRLAGLNWVRTRDGGFDRQVRFPEQVGVAGVSHFAQVPSTGEVFTGTMIRDQELPSVFYRVGRTGEPEQIHAQKHVANLFRGEIVSVAYNESTAQVIWTHSKSQGVFALAAGARAAELVASVKAKALASISGEVLIAKGGEPVLLKFDGQTAHRRAHGPEVENYWDHKTIRLEWGSHFNKVLTV
jgi:hypothetical protein